MNKPKALFLLSTFFALVLVAGCTKKAPTGQGGFTIDSPPDQALPKITTLLEQQGFSIETIDRGANMVKTAWKGMTKDELLQFASISGNPDRYKQGRYSFQIVVSEDAEGSRLEITAQIEGNVNAKQTGSEDFGIAAQWQAEASNGHAERTLFAQIAK
jgi:hypothetical protein